MWVVLMIFVLFCVSVVVIMMVWVVLIEICGKLMCVFFRLFGVWMIMYLFLILIFVLSVFRF